MTLFSPCVPLFEEQKVVSHFFGLPIGKMRFYRWMRMGGRKRERRLKIIKSALANKVNLGKIRKVKREVSIKK